MFRSGGYGFTKNWYTLKGWAVAVTVIDNTKLVVEKRIFRLSKFRNPVDLAGFWQPCGRIFYGIYITGKTSYVLFDGNHKGYMSDKKHRPSRESYR